MSDEDIQISKHFKLSEFQCRCKNEDCEKNIIPNQKLIMVLEILREHFKQPITINSGVRCQKHNAKIGGSKNSQHIQANAVDIVIKGILGNKVIELTRDILKTIGGGIGIANSFTHIDVRETESYEVLDKSTGKMKKFYKIIEWKY